MSVEICKFVCMSPSGHALRCGLGEFPGLCVGKEGTVLGTKAMSDPFVVSWKSSESSRERFLVSHESSVFFVAREDT